MAAGPDARAGGDREEIGPLAMQRVEVVDLALQEGALGEGAPTPAAQDMANPDVKAALGTLVGRVFDAGGRPVPHLTMQLGDARGAEVVTQGIDTVCNAEGYFTFSDVPVGHWEIGLASVAYMSNTWVSSAEVLANETTVHDVVLEGSRTLAGAALYSDDWENPDGNVIRMDLVDVTAGAPRIAGSAYARTRTDVVQASGRFEFSALRPGVYELRAYPFADNDYCARAIDLTDADLRLPAFVFGTDLMFSEDRGHPCSKPYDTGEDDREEAKAR